MKEKRALIAKQSAFNDYELRPGANSVWIAVDKLVVHVIRTDEGVVADIYPENTECEALASTYAFTNEALEAMENYANAISQNKQAK